VYVLLDAVSREQHSDQSPTDHTDSRQLADAQSELVAELRDQNAWLRREVERKDTIIMQMAQRIPELEAPSGPREGDQTPFEQASKGDTPPGDTEQEKRSWLHRFFFGP
jgi:predicted RNase H-like nuclease (RuvC/YqgF family)